MNLTALLSARQEKQDQFRALVESADKGEITPEETNKRSATLSAEIREFDARIDEYRNADGLGLGARTQVEFGEIRLDGRDTRTLGEAMAAEVRSIFESGGTGAALVSPEQLPRVWDMLAAESVGLASGFVVLDTVSNELRVPSLTALPSAAFYNEGDTIAESDPSAQAIVAVPRKLAAITSVGNETVADSHPAVLDMLFRTLIRSLSLSLDKAFFVGDGVAPNIKGLGKITGTQTVALAGAAIEDLDPFADAIGLLERENASAGAIVMHPAVWAGLLKLRETEASLKPLLSESATSPAGKIERRLFGVPVYPSSQLPITASKTDVYVYDPAQIAAVRRSDVRVEIDRSVYFDRDMTAVRAICRWDLAVPSPKAVVKITNALIA